MQPGLMPGARASKESVRYRQGEECSVCEHFYSDRSCELVEGSISDSCVCDKYELSKPQSPYKDKEFFKQEYEKTQPKEA